MAALSGPPDWAILGAPKAGTSTLAAWLDLHPQGFVPAAKEVAYFNLHHERGPDWYRAQFAGAAPGARLGDATPAYLYFDDVLDRLATAAPAARLIVLLREPVDRMWSHFWYNRSLGLEPRSFTRALRAEARDPTNAPYGLEIGYTACSTYVPRLEAVVARFPREQLLVHLFDELRVDPRSVFASCCRHLGIADDLGLPAGGDARNVGRSPRSAVVQHLLMRGRAGSWPGQLGPRLARLNLRAAGYPAMPEDVRHALEARFAPENSALADWLGRTLPDTWITA